MCAKCEQYERELNTMRTVVARELNSLQYNRPDAAAAYSAVVQRIDTILNRAGGAIDRRGGFGVLWQYSSLPTPLWEPSVL